VAGYSLAIPHHFPMIPGMSGRLLILFLAPAIALCLPSCGLIKVPFKVAGAVVEGTAKVSKKAYDASADALTKSDEEIAREAKEEAAKEAKQQQGNKILPPVESRRAEAPADAPGLIAPPPDYLPPLPGTEQPLPDDSSVPYEGQP